MDTNAKMYEKEGQELENPTEYRQIIGSLIYLTLTRPDIAFAVGVLSRFMQKPRRPHLFAARRVLRYVKNSIGLGIEFKRESSIELNGFYDADYAGDPNIKDRQLVTYSSLEVVWYHGVVNVKPRCPYQPLKQNIGHPRWQPKR
ncbi:uncharacterized mitochondrial protein AtMg00240-like [Helianthus annuus]|uniref:uncharacterized mitochondrial protein AtMg00240-like n=1 Tax=Helianthus annuus TaxID=4232 RepID=UPI000B90634E|nr:uncharacterized mitochondrial protein AtMg00240-like [Helianthus annuus]